MPLDSFQGDGLLVLADDGQRNAAIGQPLEGFLKLDIRLSDGIVATQVQLFPANIANNAAPQHIVEVENDDFLAATGNRVQYGDYILRRFAENRAMERCFG